MRPACASVDDLGEHLLHRQRRADLDAQPRLSSPALANECTTPGATSTTSPGPATWRAQADAEAHAPVDDLEALGLDRVHVRDRDRAAGPQREVEGEQLAAGARGGVDEGEALARDGVLERLARE